MYCRHPSDEHTEQAISCTRSQCPLLQMWKHRTLGQRLPNSAGKPRQFQWNHGIRSTIGKCWSYPNNYRRTETNLVQPHTPTVHQIGKYYGTTRGGFSKCLIRSALIRQSSNENVYLSAWKSMTIWFYIHSITKRAKSMALLDSGASENFMNLAYAKWLWLPIKQLPEPRPVLNVDGTKNKSGKLKYYTDLNVWTGQNTTTLWFFLSNLGEHKVILGYPWFAATQPRIDWKKGWINHSQLPIVLRALNAQKAMFVPRIRNIPRPIWKERYFLCRVTVHPDQPKDADLTKVPKEFHHYAKVFSEQWSQWLPKRTVWDHTIELLPNAPKSLAGRLLRLPQDKIREIEKFTVKHL